MDNTVYRCGTVDHAWNNEPLLGQLVMKSGCNSDETLCPRTNCSYGILFDVTWEGHRITKLLVETVSDGQVWSWYGGDGTSVSRQEAKGGRIGRGGGVGGGRGGLE